MKKAITVLLLMATMLAVAPGTYAADRGATVGGSLSFYLYDAVNYEKGGVDSNPQAKLNVFWLYLS
jgi:hypothetical protein